jgi:hypothetical protein
LKASRTNSVKMSVSDDMVGDRSRSPREPQ